MDAEAGRPANVLPVPRWTLLLHGIQILLAIIILGLSAYGVRWIAYNALIYALVVCICTLGVALYIIASSLFIHKLYNAYIVLAFHIWMIIFWIVDLGLVANLARIWSHYDDYSYGYYGYYSYYPYVKRDMSHLAKRDTTTAKAYYGALVAGAFFAAVQFVLWVVSAVIVAMYINKNRSNNTTTTTTHAAPPAYANNGQNAPVEPKTEQYQQQSYSVAPTPQQQYAQPAYPQQSYNGQQPYAPGPYQADPVNRQATVSPVSQAYTGPTAASELSTPQHTGGYNPNANELPAAKHN